MKAPCRMAQRLLAVMVGLVLIFCFANQALAHCDTLDGPVIQDARKALANKDVTPVLKWVSPENEPAVKQSFAGALAAVGSDKADAEQRKFFEDLVRIHRAGEGAPFTGLKPAGAVEPAVAEADKALISGSSAALVKVVTDAVASGIKERYERAYSTYQHKDDSVAAGREFVAAYVEYTHYAERLCLGASPKGAHGEHHEETEHHPAKHEHGH